MAMLAPGDRVGPYEVVSPLGSGGMGEVYRARHAKLERDVALKVLPAGALADEGARRRFRKEALALSRLSHPHVASLFDFDTTDDGLDFLVMELVPGPSLDAKLKRGPLPEKEVVRLGAQLLRALVAAHDHGILHRDLKPQNLKLTEDGLLKVLDFGLARIGPVPGDGETTDTASGSVAGTPPYMSPEQLLGKEVDARTDVYAAGVVLYEMATGRRPFGDTSGPQLVAKILGEPLPPPREANPELSPLLEQVILKATDKDRELRHPTAKDLLVDLERLAAGQMASGTRPPASGVGRTRRRPSIRLVAGLVASAALVALAAIALRAARPGVPRVTSFRTIAQSAHVFRGLATDGTNAYFAEVRFSVDALLVAPLAGGGAREMALPWEGRVDLFVFDTLAGPPSLLVGKRTSATEGFELWRLPLEGGAPSRLSGVPRVATARASRAGDRVAYVPSPEEAGAGGLYVAESGGRSERVVAPEEGAYREVVGWHSRDRRIRYLRQVAPEPEGYFDVAPGRDAEAPTEVPPGDPGWFDDASPDGRFTAWGAPEGAVALAAGRWLETRRASPAPLVSPSHVARLRFTPDGRRLVALVDRPGTEVVALSSHGDLASLLGGARAGDAAFSPDGAWVAWVTNDGGARRVWRSRPDGSQGVALTDSDQLTVGPFAGLRWSPDGRRLAFAARATRGGGPPRMHLADIEDGTVEPLTAEDARVAHIDPCWVADGRWLVYSTLFPPHAPKADTYLRRVDLATRRVEKVPGSEGLWAPKCTPGGRVLAADSLAQRAQKGGERRWFKLGDLRTGRWTPLPIDAATVDFPTWSRDGRSLFATVSRVDGAGQEIARLDPASGRLETVRRIEGLRGDGWLGLAPDGRLLVHRDASVREVVVMDWAVP